MPRPIAFRVRGVSRVKAMLSRRHRALSRLERPHREAAVYLDRWVQENFRSEGDNVGGWMPLKGGGRRKKGIGVDPSAKILQDTGRLRGSFETFHSKSNAGIRSDLEYAEPHEKGLGPIPQRRMLPVRREVIRPVREIFAKHVARGVKA